MKIFFFAIIAALVLPAHAHHTEGHLAMPSFESCESVGTMALLNKDNQPYWVADGQSEDIQSCYEDLKTFSAQATPSMIQQLELEYDGQIRIFKTDLEFVKFIQQNEQNFQPDAHFAGDKSFENQSHINVITPTKAELFNGVFQ